MTETEDIDFGREPVAWMQEAAAIVRGEMDLASIHPAPGGIDMRALRERLSLTRPAVAHRFEHAVAAVRDWSEECAGLTQPCARC